MHLSTPIRSHEPRVLSPSSYHTSESTTGLVDHLLHSRPTSTRPVHFPTVRPTFGHLVNTFSSSPLSPEPSLTCLGPSLGTSLSHLRPLHISSLSHHSQVCCSTAPPCQQHHINNNNDNAVSPPPRQQRGPRHNSTCKLPPPPQRRRCDSISKQ